MYSCHRSKIFFCSSKFMDTTGEGGGERERRFSVNICTQPSHVQDNNHVNNLNET